MRSADNPFCLDTPESVAAYLVETGRALEKEILEVSVLEGGVSNRAYLIKRLYRPDWVLKQAREKLNVAVDWFCSPNRIEREALGIHWLAKIAPPGSIPQLIFADLQSHLLVMEAVPQPHENWKCVLLRGEVDLDLVSQFGRLIGMIHNVSYDRADDFSQIFSERKYFEDLRLEPYYGYAAVQVEKAAPFMEALIRETLAHRFAIVHGDYSPKNILVHHDRLVLLDHEVIHWGDPAFDIGFSCTHFLSKAHHCLEERATFQKAALLYWKTYCDTVSGPLVSYEFEERCVRHTLACLLARVAGRSPLEYLDPSERNVQTRIVLQIMMDLPQDMPQLIQRFCEEL